MNTQQTNKPESRRDANGNIVIDEVEQAASRKKLLWIFALFFIPLLLATIWLQIVKAGGGAWGNTSRGELIVPATPLTEFTLQSLGSNDTFGLDEVRGKWTILYVPGGSCADECQKTLFDIRQARLALNHRMERVQRILLTETDPQFSENFAKEHIGLHVLTGADAALAGLTSQIEKAQEHMETKSNLVYLIDPNGNLMMRYTVDQLPKPMFKDLKHLLKVSRIG